MYILVIIAVIVLSYFIGNINFSIVISRLIGKDIRNMGSGNPGTMNMLRNFGIPLGALTLILDVFKGIVPALLGWLLLGTESGEWKIDFGTDKMGIYVGGISVGIGHVFPVIYKFKGGKAVATSLGVALVANWWLTLIAFTVGVIFLFTVKYGFITSLIVTGVPIVFEGVVSLIQGHYLCGILALCLYALIILAHHANIRRFFTGKETKTVLIKKKNKQEDSSPPYVNPNDINEITDVEEVSVETDVNKDNDSKS